MTVAADRRIRVLAVFAGLAVVAFVLGAVFGSPDPATQVLVVGPLLVLAVAVAWVVLTRTGLLA